MGNPKPSSKPALAKDKTPVVSDGGQKVKELTLSERIGQAMDDRRNEENHRPDR